MRSLRILAHLLGLGCCIHSPTGIADPPVAAAFSLGATPSTNTAQVKLFCLSIRTEPGQADEFGLSYALSFSSTGLSAPNHELFPVNEPDFTHATEFLLEGADLLEPVQGQMALVVPENEDGNTNGIPDFYEVSRAVERWEGPGFWTSAITSGELSATWSRTPGERRGIVRIRLSSNEFGELPEFTHAFELVEFDGELQYRPSADPVEVRIHLQRIGADETLRGTYLWTRDPSDRERHMTFGASVLTNEVGVALGISRGDIEAVSGLETSYIGALTFEDGEPATVEMDYQLYLLTIDDPNDVDRDGIPDLSDTVQAPPSPPSLVVGREGNQLHLTIRSQTGFEYALEATGSLVPANWSVVLQITIVETNQVVLIPAPSASSTFWRLRWP